jgi:probable phosphoglycerate mutase
MLTLVRHGETEWSRDKRHTGRSDLPLTPKGREQALLAGRSFAGRSFALVLISPLARARDTASLCGLGEVAEPDPNLMEWDYGAAEGRTTEEIRQETPGWDIWKDGPPGGETLDEVGARADLVLERALAADGDVALFSHGHLLRVLGARWLAQPAAFGGHVTLDAAGICELAYERERRVIRLWNGTGHLRPVT